MTRTRPTAPLLRAPAPAVAAGPATATEPDLGARLGTHAAAVDLPTTERGDDR